MSFDNSENIRFPSGFLVLSSGIKYEVDIQFWPFTLQILSLHTANSITFSSFEKLPSSLTSLCLRNVDLLSNQITSLKVRFLEELKNLPQTLTTLKVYDAEYFTDADISQLPRSLQTLKLHDLLICSEKCIENLPSSLTKLSLLGCSPDPIVCVSHWQIILNLEDLESLPKSFTRLKISNVTSELLEEWGKKNLACRIEGI